MMPRVGQRFRLKPDAIEIYERLFQVKEMFDAFPRGEMELFSEAFPMIQFCEMIYNGEVLGVPEFIPDPRVIRHNVLAPFECFDDIEKKIRKHIRAWKKI